MSKSDNIDRIILDAHKDGYHAAFEKAVWTGTALVFMRNGKLVVEKPPYRYKLVRIKPKNSKKKV